MHTHTHIQQYLQIIKEQPSILETDQFYVNNIERFVKIIDRQF